MIEKKLMGFKNYKDFREQSYNEKIYIRANLAQFMEEKEKQMTINRIIQKGGDYDVAMKILSIHKLPEGILIYVA